MKSKRKYYNGLIPFNLFGDQLRYPEGCEIWLEPKNFRGEEIWVKSGYPAVERKIIFNEKEIGLTKFAERKRDGWYDDGKLYIAKCNGYAEIPNYTFKDNLKYSGYSRGRSAAYFHFKSLKNNRQYTCFLTDFEQYFVDKMIKGEIEAEFTFCKRGQNFGLTIVE